MAVWASVKGLDEYCRVGIVGSLKFKKLYVSDIDANKTYVYDIAGAGKLTNKNFMLWVQVQFLI